MFTSLPITLEKARDGLFGPPQRLGPAVEELPPLSGQLVGALRRAWKLGAPLGGDEPLLLKRAQQPVEVSDVDPPLDSQLGDPLQELVAVQRPLAQEEQQRRLDEALDSCVHVPVARTNEAAAPRA